MSDTTGGFGQFVPGFEFLQKLVNPTGGAAGQSSGMPNLGSWVAPTFNVEDLEKRIEELKAVHFWLEQNSKALGATIQAMEVQKMTLATLRDLNVNFSDLAKAGEAAAETASKGFAGFEMPSAAEPAPAPASTASGAAAPKSQDSGSGAAPQEQIDPMQWWGALQQQFQNIAVNAMQDLSQQNVPTAAKKKAAASKKPAVKTAPARKKTAPAKKTAASKKAPTRSRAR